jgi:hypothetical protein
LPGPHFTRERWKPSAPIGALADAAALDHHRLRAQLAVEGVERVEDHLLVDARDKVRAAHRVEHRQVGGGDEPQHPLQRLGLGWRRLQREGEADAAERAPESGTHDATLPAVTGGGWSSGRRGFDHPVD